ncbi:DUF418 domain-containing protein [Sphingomonas sp. ABOLE]|uniref:DUF418 domain-containing protein n=1 Tax=Sphingomonas sp. ABOLE TaxID=1985878 RepID=UPI000F7E20A5|nr:DUF418 domain-containing protein [Sphingomonas sp. ABOLE]RSV38796.1 DUF418 domain-containing protein [Sphingomonas sp. ABOLE]
MQDATEGSRARAAQPAPVPQRDRLAALDVLRGAALLGILVINIQLFAGSPSVAFNVPLRVISSSGEQPELNLVVMAIQWLLFEGKMRALFSMLFGASALLLLQRLEQRHDAGMAAAIFHRRNLWLLLIGALHGTLIWSGDVLLFYASGALLVLYPLRHLPGRRLVAIGLSVALVGGTFGISQAMNIPASWATAQLEADGRGALARGALPTAAQLVALHAAEAARSAQLKALATPMPEQPRSYVSSLPAAAYREFVTSIFASGWILETLGLLIAGMGLFRTGFLTGQLTSATYAKVALAGYGIAWSIVLGGLVQASHYDFSSSVTTVAMMLPYEFQAIPGCLANASILLLLVRQGALMPLQRCLAAVGRMALTNYLFTSILCRTLFAWTYLLPVDTLEHYQMMLVVIGVWTFNIVFSLLWLRVFEFGPLEWAWRSLTYWKRQPIVLARMRPRAPLC